MIALLEEKEQEARAADKTSKQPHLRVEHSQDEHECDTEDGDHGEVRTTHAASHVSDSVVAAGDAQQV